eukprot:g7394.t1
MASTVVRMAFWLVLLRHLTSAVGVEVEEAVKPTTTTPFSDEWMEEFRQGEIGCAGPMSDPYSWRVAGYGTNINILLLAWANSIVERKNDMSVILSARAFFPRTTCNATSNGAELRGGWHCVFAPMPHLCAFNEEQDWDDFNQRRGLVQSGRTAASSKYKVPFILHRASAVKASLMGSGVDLMDAIAKLYDFIYSHAQPWFKADVQAILDEPDIAALREGKYVGMHIRRTDKLIYDGAQLTPTEKYFENAAAYLAGAPGGLTAMDISGLWLSTDDEAVFDEVKTLAPKYFPNIKPEDILFVTGRVPVRPMVQGTFDEGASDRNTYEAMVLLRLELQMLAGADVFSGTFSSNLGRIVCLMRHTLNKPKESALSGDHPDWYPGRHQ